MDRKNIKNRINKLVKDFYKVPVTRDRKLLPISDLPYGHEEVNSAINALLNGWISQGKNVEHFESKFSKKIGMKFGVATNSGSSSNLVALSALKSIYGLKDGDQVIVPASTFATVSMPVIQVGLTPVYVDINRETLNIDTEELQKAINDKTRILMPVHTLGLPCDMKKIMEIAKKNNLLVFEDCCEAHGASIDKKMVGSWGDVSAFSFFVAHNMTTGEGGMILTDDEDIYLKCQSIREFGRIKTKKAPKSIYYSDEVLKDYDRRYVFSDLGYNLRMTDICAGLGIEQTKKLDDMNKIRLRNANYLRKNFINYYNKFFEVQIADDNYVHSYYTFSFTLKEGCSFNRKMLSLHLESKGIETRPMMAGTLPDQPGLRNCNGIILGDLKNSRYVRDNTLFVGVHPLLDIQDMDYVLEEMNDFLSRNK